ncbi:ABC transporter ATP-binding protein [Lampropedia puyangensis]|uniref:ABC transporter ATP-binding protein n=1 Tax=Lampropedia puyangensis TaxID=1330072 RepID=A0A4S8F230_9BURK|nr:ABC transporter ATP-binding protein [Lampropedia puyangensis]
MTCTIAHAPLLVVNDLCVELKNHPHQTPLVQDVHFILKTGQTLGLVGESGSGKSLTALALLGLLSPNVQASGSVRMQGQELIGVRDKTLQTLRGNRISMVFQEPMTALNPVHTIGDQVAEPLRLHKRLSRQEALSQATALLDRVGIARARERLSAYPHQFSGGQRQRIVIAMALACQPALLIADEPTTALDVIVQQQILDLLDELVREQGMGLLLISHDLAVISDYTDHVAVMTEGRIVEQGPTASVFAAPQHAYTQQLMQSRQRLMAFSLSDEGSPAPEESPA